MFSDDGSDESKNPPANCNPNKDEYCTDSHMFKCEKDGCIPKSWRQDAQLINEMIALINGMIIALIKIYGLEAICTKIYKGSLLQF